jgi:hypothetical protein
MRLPPDIPESQDSAQNLSNDTPWWMQTEVANSLNSDACMADLSPLRKKARDAIRRGVLPSRRQDHIMGVSGNQRACTVCGDVVPSIIFAFEIGFRGDDTGGEIVSYQLHRRCFDAWKLEREP